jgi:hypothetical protein
MREYVVTIVTNTSREVKVPLFASDREDAIKYTKRTHRAKFISKEYRRVKGAKLIKPRPPGFLYPDDDTPAPTKCYWWKSEGSDAAS